MPDIDIPDPSLVVLVGAAGSGKSTFAARHFAPGEILSSDAFRALLSASRQETDQGATRAAFKRLDHELARRLADGRLTVVDATSVESSARRALITRAREAGIPAVAIVLDLPEDVVLARNAGRARVVDPSVVRRHLARLRAAIDGPEPAIRREGFVRVELLRDPVALDAVRIRRRPA
jgi:predicted kinase